MPWWGWLIVGIGLLGVEMFLIDAQFYLVFLGVSAVVVGLVGLAGVPSPLWAQWVGFGLLSLVTLVTFRRQLYQMARKDSGHVEERLTLGDRIKVPEQLAPGQTCRVDYRGSSWSARNVGNSAIQAGTEAVIEQVDGLTLNIKSG